MIGLEKSQMEIGVQMLKNLSLFPKGSSGVWIASQNLSSLVARGLGFHTGSDVLCL